MCVLSKHIEKILCVSITSIGCCRVENAFSLLWVNRAVLHQLIDKWLHVKHVIWTDEPDNVCLCIHVTKGKARFLPLSAKWWIPVQLQVLANESRDRVAIQLSRHAYLISTHHHIHNTIHPNELHDQRLPISRKQSPKLK